MIVHNKCFMDSLDAHLWASTYIQKIYDKIIELLGERAIIFFENKSFEINDNLFVTLWYGRKQVIHYYLLRDEMNYSHMTIIDFEILDECIENILKYKKRSES